jgi:hypothetical protein
MRTLPVCACLLLATGALVVSAGHGQPPDPKKKPDHLAKMRPHYTAFPKLKPPTIERKTVKTPDGGTQVVFEEKGVVPLPALPAPPDDAPALRKVQFEQVQEGIMWLEQVKEILRIGPPNSEYFRDYTTVAAETYRLAGELEEKLESRIPWYEARIRIFKEYEGYVELNVRAGAKPPQDLNRARFHRLQVEADLLKLKADAEKAKGK